MPVAPPHEQSQAVPPANAKQSSLPAKLFSFPVMCFLLLTAAIFAYAPRGIGIGEPDIWWRLRNATDIVQQHAIPRVDTYSFTAAGTPWTNFEWVSDLGFLLAFRSMGLRGIVALYTFAMVLIFAIVYYRSCRAGADCKDAAVVTLGGICLAAVSLAPRPELFGWVCLSALLLLLDHFRRSGHGLWLLPLLFFAWSNLHGSWIYGMVVLGVTVAGGLVGGRWGLVIANRWSPAELKKLLLALCGSIVALFVNPVGYKLVVFPFKFFFKELRWLESVEYWRPVDFGTPNGKLALVLVFGILAAGVFSRRAWRMDEVVLVLIALWTALSHVRFFDFAAIIIVPIIAPRLNLFPPYEPELDKPWLNAAIIGAVVASLIYWFPSEMLLQERINNEYPVAALSYMEQNHINARIFSPNEFGCFIDWNAPELKSFVDGREFFVTNGIYEDSIRILGLRRPLEILSKYQIRYVLVEPTQPLGYLLGHSSAWHLVHSDSVATLFERVTGN